MQELDLDSENQDSDFIDPEQIKVLRHQIGDRKRLGKFACGCGKKYNTNAALKYHVRTKHEGVQPENNNCQSTKGSRKGESGIDAIRKGTKI